MHQTAIGESPIDKLRCRPPGEALFKFCRYPAGHWDSRCIGDWRCEWEDAQVDKSQVSLVRASSWMSVPQRAGDEEKARSRRRWPSMCTCLASAARQRRRQLGEHDDSDDAAHRWQDAAEDKLVRNGSLLCATGHMGPGQRYRGQYPRDAPS